MESNNCFTLIIFKRLCPDIRRRRRWPTEFDKFARNAGFEDKFRLLNTNFQTPRLCFVDLTFYFFRTRVSNKGTMDCRATTSGGGSAAHSWIAGSSCFRKMSVVCQLANQNHSWRIMATVRWVPGYGQDLPSEAQEVGQGRFSYVRRVTHSSLRWVHRHDSDDSYAKVISRYSCNRVHS